MNVPTYLSNNETCGECGAFHFHRDVCSKNSNADDPPAPVVEEGTKHDTGKPPMSLLPWPALRSIAEVLDFGAKKYDAHNWRKGMDWSRLADAALRHLNAWCDGEDDDEESGLSHLAHAGCCLLFLITYQALGMGKDDRHGS